MEKIIGAGGQASKVSIIDWEGQQVVKKVFRPKWAHFTSVEFNMLKQLESKPQFPKPIHKGNNFYLMSLIDGKMLWHMNGEEVQYMVDDGFIEQLWKIYLDAADCGLVLDNSHANHLMWNGETKTLYRIDVGNAKPWNGTLEQAAKYFGAHMDYMEDAMVWTISHKNAHSDLEWYECKTCRENGDPFSMLEGTVYAKR